MGTEEERRGQLLFCRVLFFAFFSASRTSFSSIPFNRATVTAFNALSGRSSCFEKCKHLALLLCPSISSAPSEDLRAVFWLAKPVIQESPPSPPLHNNSSRSPPAQRRVFRSQNLVHASLNQLSCLNSKANLYACGSNCAKVRSRSMSAFNILGGVWSQYWPQLA